MRVVMLRLPPLVVARDRGSGRRCCVRPFSVWADVGMALVSAPNPDSVDLRVAQGYPQGDDSAEGRRDARLPLRPRHSTNMCICFADCL